jgi:hypothetical protein
MLGLLAGCSGGGGDDGNDEDEDDPEDSGDEETGDQGDRDRQATPTASFAFDYEETGDAEGTLEIIHDGGDLIRASSLYLRGDGYTEVANADMIENGQWAGATSGQKEGDPAVAAGDSVTLGVTSDYEIRVVWQPSTGATSATLGQDTGPDA